MTTNYSQQNNINKLAVSKTVGFPVYGNHLFIFSRDNFKL